MMDDDVIRVDFKLGFRIKQKINLFFRMVVEDLVKNKKVDFISRYSSLHKRNVTGDFRFVVLEKHLSNDNDLNTLEEFAMDWYFFLKNISLSETSAFGLDTSSVTIEKVPMNVNHIDKLVDILQNKHGSNLTLNTSEFDTIKKDTPNVEVRERRLLPKAQIIHEEITETDTMELEMEVMALELELELMEFGG